MKSELDVELNSGYSCLVIVIVIVKVTLAHGSWDHLRTSSFSV